MATVTVDPLSAVILFEASREFLDINAADGDDDSDEEDTASFVTSSLPPDFPPVALETLPLRFEHKHREEQAVAVAMGGRLTPGRWNWALEDYYTLRLRGRGRARPGARRTAVLYSTSLSPQLCPTGCWSTPSSSLIPRLHPCSLTPTPGPPSCHTGPSPHTHLRRHRVRTQSVKEPRRRWW